MSQHEIPSDTEVCSKLREIGIPTARELLSALIQDGYDSRDAQRAIQRCVDRGKIQLGAGLRLHLAREAVAA